MNNERDSADSQAEIEYWKWQLRQTHERAEKNLKREEDGHKRRTGWLAGTIIYLFPVILLWSSAFAKEEVMGLPPNFYGMILLLWTLGIGPICAGIVANHHSK